MKQAIILMTGIIVFISPKMAPANKNSLESQCYQGL